MKEKITLFLRDLIREKKISARDNLTAEKRKEFSELIAGKILNSEVFQNAGTVMIYRSVRGEVMLDGIENAPESAGKKFVYPKCISKTDMIALLPKNNNAWIKGRLGIPEPLEEVSETVQPDEIDFIICPCTAFDWRCSRLGMGAGYYDRFIPACLHANIAAVAFDCQRAPYIPAQPWDRKMEYVITEKRIYINPASL